MSTADILTPLRTHGRAATVGVGAIVLAALAGLGLAGISGATPGFAITSLWDGMAGTSYAFGSGLNRTALLLLVGTGFAVSQRAGLTNVGGEGQICLGALFGTTVGTTIAAHVPGPIALPLTLGAAAVGGAAWAGIPAWLRITRGTSEVITSLLLNFVGIGLVSLAVHETALLRQPMTSAATLPQSEPLAPSAYLPLIGSASSPATLAIVIAVVLAVVTFVVLGRRPVGLRMRAVAAGPVAAARQGIDVRGLQLRAMLASGAAAGLAGGALVLTTPFVLTDGISAGLGFAGLVVGLLGRGGAVATVLAAAGLGFLATGGVNLQLAAQVPSAVVIVMQSIVVLLLAGSARFNRRGAA